VNFSIVKGPISSEEKGETNRRGSVAYDCDFRFCGWTGCSSNALSGITVVSDVTFASGDGATVDRIVVGGVVVNVRNVGIVSAFRKTNAIFHTRVKSR